MMSNISLPPELLDLIVYNIRNDRKALKHCSLAGRALRHACLVHLHSRVCVRNFHEWRRLSIFMEVFPHLVPYISTVLLYRSDLYLGSNTGIDSSIRTGLSSINTLCIHSVDACAEESLVDLLDGLQRLRVLCVEFWCPGPTPLMMAAIHSCATVRVLAMGCNNINTEESILASRHFISERPNRVQYLQIEMKMILYLVDALKLGTVPQLRPRALELRNNQSQALDPRVKRYLAAMEPDLEEVTFRVENAFAAEKGEWLSIRALPCAPTHVKTYSHVVYHD